MTLNLSVISEDLRDMSDTPKIPGLGTITKTLVNPSIDRKLRFPVLYDGEMCPQNDRLYIAKAGSLGETVDLSAHPSFLCIGTPPDAFLKGFCDMVILSRKTKLNTLLAKIVEIFDKYNAWETALKNTIIQNRNIKMPGLVSEPIFENPLRLGDKNYKCIFTIFDKNKYTLPDNYFEIGDNEYIEIEQINLIETSSYSNIKRKPVLIDEELFGCRILRQNIFIKNKLAGAVLVEEINRTITDRDFTLITVLADAVAAMIQKTGAPSFGRPKHLEEIVRKLIEHRPVKLEQLGAVLAEMNWNVYDTYFCVTGKQLCGHPGNVS